MENTTNVRDPYRKTTREQVKEILDQLEKGVKELFESDKFKEYLTCMSKFHNYSFNNTLLNSTIIQFAYCLGHKHVSANVKNTLTKQGANVIIAA